jgi:hypothetical protein
MIRPANRRFTTLATVAVAVGVPDPATAELLGLDLVGALGVTDQRALRMIGFAFERGFESTRYGSG